MASSNMKYIVRTPDEKEYGPITQDVLTQWAANGRVPAGSEVRNMLMNKWTPVTEVAFLKNVLPADFGAKDSRSLKGKLSGLVNPDKGQKKQAVGALHRGKFEFTPASTGLRFGAWLIDTAIILLVAMAAFGAIAQVITPESQARYAVFRLFSGFMVVWVTLYYAAMLGISAQTFGQRFFGIMIVRTGGEPVLLGRAFIYAVLYHFFFWTTLPFTFVLPSKRAAHDAISGTRIIRIAVKD